MAARICDGTPVASKLRFPRRIPLSDPLILSLVLLLCGSARTIEAQEIPLSETFFVDGVTAYDATIPAPVDVLGYEVGTRHTRPDELVRYFEAIGEASPRVRIRTHGYTHEGRPLIHAIISSPANLERLESIRTGNLRLFDSPGAVSDRDIESMPGIVYMAYSVHGNEASGSEASLLALYHLAAGSGPAVDSALASLVIIIDPSLNPDGRDRFVDWVNRNRGAIATTDSQDREHNEPWPGGRTNHYWFDLNRDWLPVTQPESRARLQLFAEWRPQLLFDFHEMGGEATFFFQPGVASRTNPNTPQSNQDLTARVAKYHVRAFDRIGQPYYSGESFDDFYYGKGSTYPDLNGAVGILFEQASSRALAAETSTGELRYPRTIRNQFIATLSSIEAAVDMRRDLLKHQRDFYGSVDGWADGRSHDAWLMGRPGSGARSDSLARLLAIHGIRAYENSAGVEAGGARFAPGEAWIIPLRQPQGRLLEAMMERTTVYRDSVFYDVSTWTLPLAYDVTAYPVSGSASRSLGAAYGSSAPAGGARGSTPPLSSVGWLMPWGSTAAARSLVRWIDEGLEARFIVRSVSIEWEGSEKDFAPGTVLLTPRRNREPVPYSDLQSVLNGIAAEEGVDLIPVGSASTPSGPDLGGPGTRVVGQRTVAILTGGGLSSNRAGEVWHLLDRVTGLAVSLVDQDRVSRSDLDRYDVLIVAGGSVSESEDEVLLEWVRNGGTLVAMGSSVGWAVRSGLLELEERPFDVDSLVTGADWADLGVARSAHYIAGTILDVRLDETHPLAFGIGDRLPLFVNSGQFFDPASNRTVARFADEPLLSGWLSSSREEQVSGAAALTFSRLGRGRVVGIHADPAFRGYWKGGSRLVWNAVFFGPEI